MPSFSTQVSHRLGQAEALTRLKTFLEQVRVERQNQFNNMTGHWDGHILTFAFSAMGMGVQGNMVVEETIVLTSGQLPFAASFFRGKIEQTIRTDLERLLSQAGSPQA